jgi:hypothetical protein
VPTEPTGDPADSTDLPPAPADPGTEPSTQASTETAAALLMRALDSLPEEQRREVLRWLLERVPRALTGMAALARTEVAASSTTAATLRSSEEYVLRTALGGAQVSETTRGSLQMVPVRLPTEQHARLRAWCQEHGFAMATVIRGLLARFLDEQQPGPADGEGGQIR